jgi:protein-S-isoprenylcysteine O-methyltransferase Ste14
MLALAAASLFLLAVAKEPFIGLGSRAGAVPRYHLLVYVLWGGAMLCGVVVATSMVLPAGVGIPQWLCSHPGSALGTASIVVLLGATAMELLAKRQLADDFSIGAVAPQRIASGRLYRLENPIYDALALQVLAFGIWWWPLSLIAVAMQLLVSAGGVAKERATIEAKFGRYNRGWDSRLWDGLVALAALLARALPPPREASAQHGRKGR